MQEEKFRNKISWMMFLFSIFVIWVHSYNAELFAGGIETAEWIRAGKMEEFFSVTLGQAAVPGFFLISSYLFFRNYSPALLKKKWQERFHSILVPYLVWNSLYYFGYVAATRLPAVKLLVGQEPAPLSLGEYLGALFSYSYAPVFWYLYQLILLILLSPLIYHLVKNKITGVIYLAALLVVIYVYPHLQFPNTDALFYYSVAAFGAVHFKKTVERPWSRGRESAAAWGMLAAVFCLWRMEQPGAVALWTVLYRLLLPVSLWFLVNETKLFPAKVWMKQSLYLYAVHFIIVRFINKGGAMFLRNMAGGAPDPFTAMATFFLMPLFVICLSYFSAAALNRFFPAVWRVLSGGRRLE